MDYVLLKDVKKDSHCWKICVRITRVSRYTNGDNPPKLLWLDFVMLDEQGGMMEGRVPTRQIAALEPLIKEGSVYYIHYFQVANPKPTYRAVDHPYMARLTSFTRVTKITHVPDTFPVYAYKLASYQVLRNRASDTVVMSDTIGLMTAVSHLSTVLVRGAPRAVRNVHITNGREIAIVALWGPHAHEFPAEQLQEQSQREPVVILFVGVTSRIRAGQLSLQGSTVCKWYPNAPIPEVVALQNSFIGMPHSAQWFGRSADQNEPRPARVNEIWNLNPHSTMGNSYIVDILIKGLVPYEKWWYMACHGCKRTISRVANGYKCAKCSGTKIEIRYRLALLGLDPLSLGDEDAKTAEFVFFGDIGEKLVGVPALDLVASCQGPGCIPPEITMLYGRFYTLKVGVSRGSMQRERISYLVDSMQALPAPTPASLGTKGKQVLSGFALAGTHESIASQTLPSQPDVLQQMVPQTPTGTGASASVSTTAGSADEDVHTAKEVEKDKDESANLSTPPSIEAICVMLSKRSLSEREAVPGYPTHINQTSGENEARPTAMRKLFTEDKDAAAGSRIKQE